MPRLIQNGCPSCILTIPERRQPENKPPTSPVHTTSKWQIVGVVDAQHVADVLAAQTPLRTQIVDFLYWSRSTVYSYFGRLKICITLCDQFGIRVRNLYLQTFRESPLKRHQHAVVPGPCIRLGNINSFKVRIQFLRIRRVFIRNAD